MTVIPQVVAVTKPFAPAVVGQLTDRPLSSAIEPECDRATACGRSLRRQVAAAVVGRARRDVFASVDRRAPSGDVPGTPEGRDDASPEDWRRW